jgi:RNA polymerase sigma factor (sigma-70 family)
VTARAVLFHGLMEDVVSELAARRCEFVRFLQRQLGNEALAEDVFQDAFARALEKAHTLRRGESAVSWLYRVLRNAVIDHRRRRAAAERAVDAVAAETDEASPEVPPDDRDALCKCIGEIAASLKPQYSEALRRIEIDGLAVHEYAKESGLARGTAAVRVFRARVALRRRVQLSCGACAAGGCTDCTCSRHGVA